VEKANPICGENVHQTILLQKAHLPISVFCDLYFVFLYRYDSDMIGHKNLVYDFLNVVLPSLVGFKSEISFNLS